MFKIMNIYEEYINYHNQYSRKYGKKTLVLEMVGSFYESYSTKKNDQNDMAIGEGPDLHEISQILNIVCTRKDKSINTIDKKNPYMLGFPIISATKFINILVEHGYTIIIVDQITPPPNPKRQVTNIYSPGTFINGPQKPDYNFIITLYIEENIQKSGKYLLSSGMAAIDITTGKCYINEAHAAESDDKYSLDECLRFLNGINPTEIIIIFKEQNNGIKKEDLFLYLEIQNRKNVHYRKEINKKYTNLNYQIEFLKKVYADCGLLNPIEYLEMDKLIYAVISFIVLLDFLYDHNNKIINNLNKPEIYFDTRTVVLGNNAINQLNIIDNNSNSGSKYNSLFSVINQTSTYLGRRFLKDRITNPIISHNELNKNYDCISELILNNKYLDIENILKEISDIERLEHKIPLGYLHPYELAILIQSYEQIELLIKEILLLKFCKLYCPNHDIIKLMDNFKLEITKTFKLEELKKHNLNLITTNIFQKGIFKEIDLIEENIFNNINFINDIKDIIIQYVEDKNKDKTKSKKKINNDKNNIKGIDANNLISIKKNDRDGYFLNITKNRCAILKKNLDGIKILDIKGYKLKVDNLIFKDNNGNTKIFIPDVITKSEQITELEEKIMQLNYKYYLEILQNLYNKYKILFKSCNKFVAIIDFFKSNAKTSKLYGYTRPTIKYNNNFSFIECKKLRHPIIERLIDYEYVPHDMEVGKNYKGILLYGLNSSGKCFDPNTLIKLYNGTSKKAIDINVGDKLMGDDFTCRNVLSTCLGKDIMYKITSKNNNDIIVNGPHILCLKSIGYKKIIWKSKIKKYKIIWFENFNINYKYFINYIDGLNFFNNVKTDINNIIEISTIDYLKKSKLWKKNYYLYKVDYNITNKNINKLNLNRKFKIEKIGLGDYCGFEVDGNKRFLLEDFTVTHNSSSMKALGLCTIMAQAGMFVPAEQCIFSPYKSIFTRITGNDNLFKGISSFTLEMLELKAILKRASPYTLVIGDEVCRGTEQISGNSIVASTIIILSKLNCSFIFATHLHEIAQMDRIKEINNIKTFHLSVSYDPKTDTLIYDRQLKEGQGETIYGITVAKYIIQDKEFTDLALDIKNEQLKNYGSMISGKTSKYNSQVYIHECQICHVKDIKGYISNLQTHHINFQKDCQDGFVKNKKYLKKNDKSNLVVLCIDCHNKIHHKNVNIEGTIQTSNGKKLKIKKNSK